MKLALSSLKTVDYKQLLINHGEKVVIAIIGVMVATVLYNSNWKATEKTPTAFIEKADKAKKEIEENPWSEKSEKQKAGLGKGNELASKVSQMLTPINVSAFGIQPLDPPLHPDKTLISMPRWLPVQDVIAEAGAAEFTLKPGMQPLEESFIRKPPKEKDSKSKGPRERAKRKEATPPKKEKKEESDDAIPDELKPKQAVQGGFGMTGGPLFAAKGTKHDKHEDRKGRRRTGAGPEPETVEAVAVAPKPVGRGYRFVAVRGVFPLRNQVSELARAMGVATNEKELHGMVQFRDFKLERQTRVERQGADPWSGPWEAVDRDAVMQLLENDVNGYAPETVLDGLLDSHICMPYPDRVVGQWGLLASHPDIKEFNLSDDEVDKQVEYEWKLLERVKQQEEKTKAPAEKGGFTAIAKNMRPLTSQAQGTEGQEKSVREKILEELESGKGDKEQMNEQLAEFVRTRATPVDHYVLFRYLDIKVDPGKTYRYRVKLILTNPFRERRVEEVTDPSIIEGEERETEYSEPTSPVTVKEDAQFFVKRIDSRIGRPSLPYAEMDIFQWFVSTGTVVNQSLQTQIGQILGGRKKADVLRPAEGVFDKESVLFSTSDALVDVSSAFSLDASLHKDILDSVNVPTAKRVGATAPDEVLVVDENGELHVIDGLDQKSAYDSTKTHYDQQNKAFESLRKTDDLDDEPKKHTHRTGKDDPRRAFGNRRGGKNK
jgi:hypothetical protein